MGVSGSVNGALAFANVNGPIDEETYLTETYDCAMTLCLNK